jgi:hypothetical protein
MMTTYVEVVAMAVDFGDIPWGHFREDDVVEYRPAGAPKEEYYVGMVRGPQPNYITDHGPGVGKWNYVRVQLNDGAAHKMAGEITGYDAETLRLVGGWALCPSCEGRREIDNNDYVCNECRYG